MRSLHRVLLTLAVVVGLAAVPANAFATGPTTSFVFLIGDHRDYISGDGAKLWTNQDSKIELTGSVSDGVPLYGGRPDLGTGEA